MTVLDTHTVTPEQRVALLAEVPTELLIGYWRPAERRGSFVVEKRDAIRRVCTNRYGLEGSDDDQTYAEIPGISGLSALRGA
jgi:hypothetical protein